MLSDGSDQIRRSRFPNQTGTTRSYKMGLEKIRQIICNIVKQDCVAPWPDCTIDSWQPSPKKTGDGQSIAGSSQNFAIEITD